MGLIRLLLFLLLAQQAAANAVLTQQEAYIKEKSNIILKDSTSFSLTGILEWKAQLALLAEDERAIEWQTASNGLYIQLKRIEQSLLIDRQVPRLENWDAHEELAATLPLEHPLKWYLYHYRSLYFLASGDLREAEVSLKRAYGIAQASGISKYERSSLIVLFELQLINAQPILAAESMRQLAQLNRNAAPMRQVPNSGIHSPALAENNHLLPWDWRVLVGGFMLLVLFVALWLKMAGYKITLMPLNSPSEGGLVIPNTTWPILSKPALRPYEDSEETLTDEEIIVDEQKVELLAELRAKKILTDEDWFAFQQVFTQVHPDFLVHLRFRHKHITPAEEKLACLIRVHFSTKEIARLLAISNHAVNVGRYRLKKKFQLDQNATLEEYLMSF